jgi:hypothetical protein
MYEATQLLRLRNPGVDPIAFKVKTTAPKQYCVRPNAGRIEPGEEVEVQGIFVEIRDFQSLFHEADAMQQ